MARSFKQEVALTSDRMETAINGLQQQEAWNRRWLRWIKDGCAVGLELFYAFVSKLAAACARHASGIVDIISFFAAGMG
jgi:hypothetical protein